MNILLPMDRDDTQEGELTGIYAAKTWALVVLEEGKVVEINFYADREAVNEWVDAIVVINDFEPVMPFIEEQIMVLVAHTQRTIDAIVEAILFKELNELAY